MPRVTTSDGRVLEWEGKSICYCSKCEVLFNSVAAFDMHIKRKSGRSLHDTSGMPLNEQGRYITRAMPSEAVPGQRSKAHDDS